MDVTSLYTNIPQEEGITTVCNAYERLHNYKHKPPIPTHFLTDMLRLILKENSFQFNGKNYLQIHGTAMGTKMAVSFANLFMAAVETEILNASTKKTLVWKRYIDDVFSLWNINIEEIDGSLNRLTDIIQPSNLRLKYQTKKPFSWIPVFTKGIHFEKHLSLKCELITSRQKHFNIHISLPATHQGSARGSSKAKHLDFFEPTPQKNLLRRILEHSNHAFA